MSKTITLLFVFFALTAGNIFSQEYDITQYLKEIEKGNAAGVLKILPRLKKEHPNDPSVIFLDAVLTKNGEEALQKYFTVYSKFPKSNYADASLYRIFSFYFAMGLYDKAEKYLQKLKSEYPKSPYVKYAERNIPQQDLNTIVLPEKKDSSSGKKRNIVEALKYKKKKNNKRDVNTEQGFTVQAGAFLNISNAKKLQRKFIEKGWAADVYPKSVGGTVLNVVTVGKFKSKTEAENFLTDLKNEFGLNGRVVPNRLR